MKRALIILGAVHFLNMTSAQPIRVSPFMQQVLISPNQNSAQQSLGIPFAISQVTNGGHFDITGNAETATRASNLFLPFDISDVTVPLDPGWLNFTNFGYGVKAKSFSGSGTNLTGVVLGVAPGSNVTTSTNNGVVTVNASGGGGSQTPILQDVDFGGFSATNITSVLMANGLDGINANGSAAFGAGGLSVDTSGNVNCGSVAANGFSTSGGGLSVGSGAAAINNDGSASFAGGAATISSSGAGSFSGGLSASDLTSGVVSDDRLTGAYPNFGGVTVNSGVCALNGDGSASFASGNCTIDGTTGKITATGVVDPPMYLLDRISEADALQLYVNQVPENKRTSLALFFNGTNMIAFVGSTKQKFKVPMELVGTVELPKAQPKPKKVLLPRTVNATNH